MNNSRRSQVKKITQMLYDSIYVCFAVYGEELQGILDEEQEAYDNFPEGIQESDRGQQMSDFIDNMETVIYISCNPETLACDLRYLTKMGPYRMVGAQPVDMFPQTSHVECVSLLSLNHNPITNHRGIP